MESNMLWTEIAPLPGCIALGGCGAAAKNLLGRPNVGFFMG